MKKLAEEWLESSLAQELGQINQRLEVLNKIHEAERDNHINDNIAQLENKKEGLWIEFCKTGPKLYHRSMIFFEEDWKTGNAADWPWIAGICAALSWSLEAKNAWHSIVEYEEGNSNLVTGSCSVIGLEHESKPKRKGNANVAPWIMSCRRV